MMFLYQLWGAYIVRGFPGVITFGVPFPFDQVLEFAPLIPMGPDGLDFVLRFTLDHVRRWPRVVLTVFFCFDVGRKEGGVENGVDVPLRWES